MTFQELQEKYEEALSRVNELEREIARLRRVLQEHRIALDDYWKTFENLRSGTAASISSASIL